MLFKIFKITLILVILSACSTLAVIEKAEYNKNEIKLLNLLANSKKSYVKYESALSLGRLKSENAVSLLLEKIIDPKENEYVKTGCIKSLGMIQNQSAVDPLLNLLKTSKSTELICLIIETLSLFDDSTKIYNNLVIFKSSDNILIKSTFFQYFSIQSDAKKRVIK